MDNWQSHVYSKMSAFIDEKFVYTENEVNISLNQREAYVVLKALEDQQKYLNPTMSIGGADKPSTVPIGVPERLLEA